MKNLFYLLLLILPYKNLFAHNSIINNGFLVYLDNTWFFQPCNDSSMVFLDCLNSASFRITNGTDGFNNVLYSAKKQLPNFYVINNVNFKWKLDNSYSTDTLRYIYCELEYKNTFSIENENLNPCMYDFLIGDKRYSLGCFNFSAQVFNLKLNW